MSQPLPAEVRKARSFLFSQHKHGFGIPPRKFAASSKELGVSFRELLKFISNLQMRGQGMSSVRQEEIRNIASRGATPDG
jgi:hypothetical protein